MRVRELQKHLQRFIDHGGNPNMQIILPIAFWDVGTHCDLSGYKIQKMHKNGRHYDPPVNINEEKNSVDRMILEFYDQDKELEK